MVRREHLIAVVVAFLIGCAFLLMAGASRVQGRARNPPRSKDTLTLPSRDTLKLLMSKDAHPKQRCPKVPDARRTGTRGALPRTTYPAAPRAACSWAPTKETGWPVMRARTRYVPLAVVTISLLWTNLRPRLRERSPTTSSVPYTPIREAGANEDSHEAKPFRTAFSAVRQSGSSRIPGATTPSTTSR